MNKACQRQAYRARAEMEEERRNRGATGAEMAQQAEARVRGAAPSVAVVYAE